MRYLVQGENVALFAVILGPFADCASSLTTFWGGEARMPVTALLDQRGDIVLGSDESMRNSLVLACLYIDRGRNLSARNGSS
jgi:hypothetical protein